MKQGIHPKYELTNYSCSCGNTFSSHSSKGGDLHIELCNECHPFFTGQQKLIDMVDVFSASLTSLVLLLRLRSSARSKAQRPVVLPQRHAKRSFVQAASRSLLRRPRRLPSTLLLLPLL